MAKQSASKRKKSAPKNKFGISTRSYNLIKKEANNVRSRIREFLKRPDSGEYFVPDTSNYTLDSLGKRIMNGETVKGILAEIRRVTADNLKKVSAQPVVSDFGYKLKPSEQRAIHEAVNKANANITEARNKWNDPLFTDVLPELRNANEIIRKATDYESIQFQLELLKEFVPEKLDVIAIDEYGTAGTEAEANTLRKTLERENKRRDAVRRQIMDNVKENGGFFYDQDTYESKPIDIKAIEDLDQLRYKAGIWDDAGTVIRANRWLQNYEKALNNMQAILINQGMLNSTIEERINYIHDIISKIYNNAKIITLISRTIPNIEIELISHGADDGLINVYGNINFDAIYNSWSVVDEDFL